MAMQLSISGEQKAAIIEKLGVANQAFNQIYKGDRADRQPIHTLYQGADVFHSNVISELSSEALKTFLSYAPNWVEFGKAFQLKGFEKLPEAESEIEKLIIDFEKLSTEALNTHPLGFIYTIYQKVISKLKSEAIEDYRIDFEDGYGNKTNQQEDETAVFVARELAIAMRNNTLPYFIGIRTKAFTEEGKERSIRTMDILLTTLLTETNGILPSNFVIMLPKVTIPEQVIAMDSFLSLVEIHFKLPKNAIKIEMMVETTQAVMDINGTNPLYQFIKASNGRCHAMHFGTYDYTASCGITAAYQEMDHPVCDFAHHVTKVALAHTGIWLSDGATNTVPKGPHSGELTPITMGRK
jgi:citrate lyase beta subunit